MYSFEINLIPSFFFLIAMKSWIAQALFFLLSFASYAQGPAEMVYRRGSLNVAFINDYKNLPVQKQAVIQDVVNSYKVSDKYNIHQVTDNFIDLSDYSVTFEEIQPYEQEKKFGGKLLDKYMSYEQKARWGYLDESKVDPIVIAKINKYLEDCHIPGYLVTKWFNMSDNRVDDSFFNMDLIMERGAYGATTLDRLRSNESLRKSTLLMDAGMDLIPNTFLVLIRLNYMSFKEWHLMLAEEYRKLAEKQEKKAREEDKHSVAGISVRIVRDEAGEAKRKEDLLKSAAMNRELADKQVVEAAEDGEGYIVSATTYLYQLIWDNQISDDFLSKYYNMDTPQDLISNNVFHVKYVGRMNCQTMLKESVLLNYEENQILKDVTLEVIDKAFAKLQRKYEDFAVKAPIIDVEGNFATAFVGLKEGITSRSKFDVLELNYNEKKDIYRYEKVGSLSVDKKRVWDNRYGGNRLEILSDDENGEQDDIEGANGVDRSYFKITGGKVSPGMIIRQSK